MRPENNTLHLYKPLRTAYVFVCVDMRRDVCECVCIAVYVLRTTMRATTTNATTHTSNQQKFQSSTRLLLLSAACAKLQTYRSLILALSLSYALCRCRSLGGRAFVLFLCVFVCVCVWGREGWLWVAIGQVMSATIPPIPRCGCSGMLSGHITSFVVSPYECP